MDLEFDMIAVGMMITIVLIIAIICYTLVQIVSMVW